MGTDKNLFHFSLTLTGKVTTQCLEEKRAEAGIEPMPSANQPNALPLGQSGSQPKSHRCQEDLPATTESSWTCEDNDTRTARRVLRGCGRFYSVFFTRNERPESKVEQTRSKAEEKRVFKEKVSPCLFSQHAASEPAAGLLLRFKKSLVGARNGKQNKN